MRRIVKRGNPFTLKGYIFAVRYEKGVFNAVMQTGLFGPMRFELRTVGRLKQERLIL